MSKRALKNYVKELTQEQLAEQVVELYDRFKEVKEFYDFVFNPQEGKMLEEAKFAISKEYFPVNRRKAKARRSVAQKVIRKFKTLGVDPHMIAELMVYNIKLIQTFITERQPTQNSIFTSLYRSFDEVLKFCESHGLLGEFDASFRDIIHQAITEKYLNSSQFEKTASLYIQM